MIALSWQPRDMQLPPFLQSPYRSRLGIGLCRFFGVIAGRAFGSDSQAWCALCFDSTCSSSKSCRVTTPMHRCEWSMMQSCLSPSSRKKL